MSKDGGGGLGGGGFDYVSLISELVKTGVDIKEQGDAKTAAARQAQLDKNAAEASASAQARADSEAKRLRDIAAKDTNTAHVAAIKAKAEKETFGPLHVLAQNAADKAQMSEKLAREAEAKAAPPSKALEPASATSSKQSKHWYSRVPWWGWTLGGVAVVGLGAVAITRRRK